MNIETANVVFLGLLTMHHADELMIRKEVIENEVMIEPPASAEVIIIPSSPVIPDAFPARPTVRQIFDLASEFYGVSIAEALSNRHHAYIVRARHVALYLAIKYTTLSLKAIGRIANRDPTSIGHARDKITAGMIGDERLRDEVEILSRHLNDWIAEQVAA